MHQTKTGILLANLGTPDAPTPGGEALSATIPQRQTGGGYVSSAMVAAAARRHTADSLPARGEALSVRVDGRGIAADGV